MDLCVVVYVCILWYIVYILANWSKKCIGSRHRQVSPAPYIKQKNTHDKQLHHTFYILYYAKIKNAFYIKLCKTVKYLMFISILNAFYTNKTK